MSDANTECKLCEYKYFELTYPITFYMCCDCMSKLRKCDNCGVHYRDTRRYAKHLCYSCSGEKSISKLRYPTI